MLGLALAVYDYEFTFNAKTSSYRKKVDLGISWVVVAVTLLNIMAVFMKEHTAQVWYDFRDPIIFYKT